VVGGVCGQAKYMIVFCSFNSFNINVNDFIFEKIKIKFFC